MTGRSGYQFYINFRRATSFGRIYLVLGAFVLFFVAQAIGELVTLGGARPLRRYFPRPLPVAIRFSRLSLMMEPQASVQES